MISVFLCFLVCIFCFSIFCYWHCELYISLRLVISKICFFFSLPIVFSILSIMLQAILQKLMVVVVVFFYLLILKGPVFLPGLVFFPQKQVERVLFWTDHVHLDTVRDLLGEVRLEGRMPVPCPASEGAARGARAMGHAGRSPRSWFLSFSGKATVPHARPNVSDLLPGTQIVQSLCPTSHTQLQVNEELAAWGGLCLWNHCLPALCTSRSPDTAHPEAPSASATTLATFRITPQSGHPRLSASRMTWKPRPPTTPTGLKSHSAGPLWGAPWVPPLCLTAFAYLP